MLNIGSLKLIEGKIMSDFNWRSKVEALLNKAQARGTTQQEAEALQEKAAYLMAKYGIEDAIARDKEHKNEKPKVEKFQAFPPYSQRKINLLNFIANTLGGRVVVKNDTMWVFAYEQDLERIKVLYFSLLAQMHIELSSIRVPASVHAKSYRNSWLVGFNDSVNERIQRAYRKAKNEKPGSALAILDRTKNVEARMHEQFPDLIKRHVRTNLTSMDGYSEGVAAGQRADIGRARFSGTDPKKPLTHL